MLQELIFTSAPVGLKPGSEGFCTVACTTGMPPNLAKLLETLSGYRHVFLPPDPNANNNPASCSHLLLNLGGVPWHILSRTGDAGLDYMKRTNKISHHIVIDKAELQDAGPVAILTQYPFLVSWNQKPVVLPANKKLPSIQSQARICEQWAKLTGDAGWGGILAETALTKRPVSIIFRPGMNILPLFDEAMALLKPEQRWQISFSTYCCNLPAGTGCQWKGILAGSPEIAQARATGNTLVLDLTQPLGKPPVGQLVEAARSGKVPTEIIPLAIQGEDQPVYGIKDMGTPPQPGQPVAPAVVPKSQETAAPSPKNPSAKKKKGSEDPSSKGCFWLIILFFILVTAGLIGGVFWLFSDNLTKKGDVTVQGKNIEELQTEIDRLNRRIADNQNKQEQLATDNAKWQEDKDIYAKVLSDKDAYISEVAGYFSLFPQVNMPPIAVDLKDGVPRRDGDQVPQKNLLTFAVATDRNWNFKELLSVTAESDDAVECVVASNPETYPAGDVFLKYPCDLQVTIADGVVQSIATFEVVVMKDGIFVRDFNDDVWHKFVGEGLAGIKNALAENDAFQLSSGFSDWYEANVKDGDFVLNEDMLKKIDELDESQFRGDFAYVQQLIDLRKRFYAGQLTLDFTFGFNLVPLGDKVRRDKP